MYLFNSSLIKRDVISVCNKSFIYCILKMMKRKIQERIADQKNKPNSKLDHAKVTEILTILLYIFFIY
jgi:hypothetical protein